MDLLRRLHAWYDDTLPELQAKGWTVEFSEPLPERSKPSASVTVTSPSRIGKLTVWMTGEAELGFGDAESGEVIEEHREIGGDLGLTDATRTLLDWVRGV